MKSDFVPDIVDGFHVAIGKIAIEVLSTDQQRTYLEECSHCSSSDSGRILTTSAHWTYLRISEGCNHKCSYCTIPAIRGPFRSKDIAQIRLEANELASAGIVELNLIRVGLGSVSRGAVALSLASAED